MYAKIVDDELVETTENLRKALPNVGFPKVLPDEWGEWKKVVITPPLPRRRITAKSSELVDGVPHIVYTYAPITKDDLTAYVEDAYKVKILQPITLHGLTIVPDDKTLNRLNNKIQAMRKRDDPQETTTWIGLSGAVEMTLAKLEDIGMEADNQWQPYFDALPGIFADIQSGEITDFDGVDAALDGVYA